MNKEDKKLQKHLVDEMMKVSKTNPDVMIYMQALMESYEKLEQKVDRLNNIIKIMENYLELIYDLGYDHDGLETTEDLMNLMDELVRYASLGRAYNITEPIYENNGKKYNILHEELKEGNK